MIFAPSGGGGGVNVWVTSTVYAAGDIVYYGKVLYLCVTAHTSAAAFETDLAATKWRPLSQQVINYISDTDGSNLGKWVTYADAAGTAPVDGTGGAPNSTFAVSTSTALRGTTNFLFTKNSGASRQGEGFSYDFSIDPSDQGKVVQISFEYLITSAAGTYVDNDLSVWVYDVTNSALIQPAPTYILNSTLIEKYATQFQTSSSSTSYRLIVHIGGTTNSTATIRFSNFNVGPQAKLYGSPVTDWVSYTPTFVGFGTVTNISIKSRKVGDTLEVLGLFQAGTVTATTASMTLGFNGVNSNVTMDSAKITGGAIIGYGATNSTPTTTYFGNITPIANVGSSVVNFGAQSSTTSAMTAANGNALIGNNAYIEVFFKVPILGWSSSVVMSSDADTRVVAANYSASGTQSINNNTTTALTILTTKNFDTHNAFNTSTGTYTVPVSGTYRVSLSVATNSSITAAAIGNHFQSIIKNGSNIIAQGNQFSQTTSATPYWASATSTTYCLAGDTITANGYTTLTGAAVTFGITNMPINFTIERISGPSAIAASETVAARVTTSNSSIAYNSATAVIYSAKTFDSHGAYNTSTGVFTAPVSGLYQVSASVNWGNLTTTTGNPFFCYIYKNGGIYSYGNFAPRITAEALSVVSDTVKLLAGETVQIYAYQADSASSARALTNDANKNYFSVTRVGNY